MDLYKDGLLVLNFPSPSLDWALPQHQLQPWLLPSCHRLPSAPINSHQPHEAPIKLLLLESFMNLTSTAWEWWIYFKQKSSNGTANHSTCPKGIRVERFVFPDSSAVYLLYSSRFIGMGHDRGWCTTRAAAALPLQDFYQFKNEYEHWFEYQALDSAWSPDLISQLLFAFILDQSLFPLFFLFPSFLFTISTFICCQNLPFFLDSSLRLISILTLSFILISASSYWAGV